MNAKFADTFHFLALLNRNDRAHRRAVEASQSRTGALVTTEFVLLEVADAMSGPKDRFAFLQLLTALRADDSVIIDPVSSDRFEQGVALFAARSDKEWSLTDCVSFVVMQEHKLTDALTGDRHFVRAGFRALLLKTATD